MLPRTGIISARQPLLAEVLALLHCSDYSFPTSIDNAVITNSIPNGLGFTGYSIGGGGIYWYGGEPIFGQGIFGGDDGAVLHSNTKVIISGAFCIEGFFFPVGTDGPIMEIADGDSWNNTGSNYLSMFLSAGGQDDNNYYVNTIIYARLTGGGHSDIAVSNQWTLPKVEANEAHVAFYRDSAGYVGMSYRGQEMVRTASPFPGTFNGYINLGSAYDSNTNTIPKGGGHRTRFGEWRVTRGSSVYTPPFTPRSSRFP